MDRPETGHAPGSCCHKTKERAEAERKRLLQPGSAALRARFAASAAWWKRTPTARIFWCSPPRSMAAINAFNRDLLANHIRTCVAHDIRAGDDEVIDELVATLQKLMK